MNEFIKSGLEILEAEADSIKKTAQLLDDKFSRAVEIILNCKGRVCVCGIGKAGIIGKKIQATLASTGVLSYFLHPSEALHGDIGMVHSDDVIIALSRSGNTEITSILPTFKQLNCKIILISAKAESPAGKLSDVVLQIGVDKEICPLGLAPSSSTTAMLALGDALALTVMKFKKITEKEYAFNHPGGALGRNLMLANQIARTGKNCPIVDENADIETCYKMMTEAPLRAGAVLISDANNKLKGIITQGDLFRLAFKTQNAENIGKIPAVQVMIKNPKTILDTQKVVEAISLMKKYLIDELPVVTSNNTIVGLIDIGDLTSEGFEIL